jgi:hypothetical protein
MSTLWDSHHENLLKKWGSLSATYNIMHTLSAAKYAKLDRMLGIPVILIGSVTASSIFADADFIGDRVYMSYLNGGLTLLVTALSGISKLLRTSENIANHRNASFKYSQIKIEIDSILSFNRNKRYSTPQEFISKIKRDMLEVQENCPDVSLDILNKYIDSYNKNLVNNKTCVNNTKEYEKLINCKHRKYNAIANSPGVQFYNLIMKMKDKAKKDNKTILSDDVIIEFSDKLSQKMIEASIKMEQLSEDFSSNVNTDEDQL